MYPYLLNINYLQINDDAKLKTQYRLLPDIETDLAGSPYMDSSSFASTLLAANKIDCTRILGL